MFWSVMGKLDRTGLSRTQKQRKHGEVDPWQSSKLTDAVSAPSV